jgi:RimJ/RimL family protein N-acetyltransferase
VVRCWEPRDARLLKKAVDSSLDHLREWMPWAHDDPQPLSEKVELLRMFRGKFDLGQEFVYGIFSADESEVVGGTGLHRRSFEGVLEIGYWISAERAGHGFGTEATAAVARVGFEVADASRIEIRVATENAASLAIPRKLGFVEEGTLRRFLHGPDGTPLQRDAVVFALVREELAGSPVASVELRAFDAAGERVL